MEKSNLLVLPSPGFRSQLQTIPWHPPCSYHGLVDPSYRKLKEVIKGSSFPEVDDVLLTSPTFFKNFCKSFFGHTL